MERLSQTRTLTCRPATPPPLKISTTALPEFESSLCGWQNSPSVQTIAAAGSSINRTILLLMRFNRHWDNEGMILKKKV
jgi:hypothetical protein